MKKRKFSRKKRVLTRLPTAKHPFRVFPRAGVRTGPRNSRKLKKRFFMIYYPQRKREAGGDFMPDELKNKTAFISDMDSVIYHGNRLLPGAADFVRLSGHCSNSRVR